jgi:hypothetical protein
MKPHQLLLPAAALLLLGLNVTPAHADDINYSFTAFGETATLTLPSNPTPSSVGTDSFTLDDISVTVPGFGVFSGNLTFFDSAAGGGAGSGVDILNGPQLFSGPLSDPTLLTGDFTLSGSVTPDPDGPVAITGVLSAVSAVVNSSPVPEPSSLALLLTGITTIAGAMCLRRQFTGS